MLAKRIVGFVLLFLAGAVNACSFIPGAPVPAPPSRDQQFAAADLVVTGTVRRVEPGKGHWSIVRFRVDEVGKGKSARTVVFSVADPPPLTDCPYYDDIHQPFSIGEGLQRVYLKHAKDPDGAKYYAIFAESAAH